MSNFPMFVFDEKDLHENLTTVDQDQPTPKINYSILIFSFERLIYTDTLKAQALIL